MEDNKKYMDLAVKAARSAGEILMREFSSFDRGKVMLKSAHEIVTRADLLSEEEIIKSINKEFPYHGILSEEQGSKDGSQGGYKWIVDPLDGTTNFSIHNPLWSVSIALAKDDELVLGVVYAPALDELYLAEAGKGAALNGRKIAVSEISKGKVINTFCHGKRDKDIKKALAYYKVQKLKGFDCRQLGSAAVELGYVAAGRVESIMIPGANLWDVAAGILLVREAGGKVTDFKGKKWTLESEDMLASNGKVHGGLLEVLK